MESFSGRKYICMFTDDMTRVRWIVLLESKDKAVDALQDFVREVTDPEGSYVNRLRRDEGYEFESGFAGLTKSLGIEIETEPLYVPQGNSIAERGLDTIIGITRSL